MNLLLTACAAATALLVLAAVLPMWRNPHWLVRGFDFPRLQLAVLGAVLLVAQVLLLDFATGLPWLLVGATAASLAWQLWWILPYTPLLPVEVAAATSADAANTLRILTANVLTPNRNAEALIRLVQARQPDILVTLESDQWWQDQLDQALPDMPHRLACPLDNLYGMHLYARQPLAETAIEYLVEDDVPSMHALVRLRSGAAVRMHFLHPAPPSPTENEESAERDAELVVVARSVAQSDLPVVVTGDLNDVAWSPTTRLFRKLSGLLDPRVGRGFYNTFHADYALLRWPLDHMFHSGHFTVAAIERLPSIGSDHFPLYAELVLTGGQGDEDAGLDATDEAREWGREVVDGEDVVVGDVPRPGE